MADTERLMNKAQGDDIISALGTIAANILQVPSEKLIIDWSYTTLPASGNDHTIYAIPTGDADDPWDFYVWNDIDEEWVQFDWTFAVDSALSTTSENPVQNKVVKGALDGKVDTVTGKGLSTNDYTDAEKALVATIPNKADSADVEGTKSVTGNPLTLTDAAPINAESLVVELEPIQEGSGDPSPTNVRPITGYTECEVKGVGKNLLDPSNIFETGKYINSSGGFNDSQNYNTYKFELEPNQYVISKYDNSTAIFQIVFSLACFDTNDTLISNTLHYSEHQSSTYRKNIAFEYPQNAAYVLISLRISSYDIQLEQGSTATQYEPYRSSNATIQFGQTVYGGKSNFTDGGTDDGWTLVDFGDLTWTNYKTGGYSTEDLKIYIKKPTSTAVIADCISECYKTMPANATLQNGEMSVDTSGTVYVVNTDYPSSASDFKTAMTGLKICYGKATPDTISTPPTDLKLLQGTNNITTNGTTINLGYQPDNVIGEVKVEIEKCAVDAEFMQFTDGTDTFTDVNLSLDAYLHTVSVVGSKIEQKRFICFEVMDKMGGVLQGILASCIAFADGAKTPSGTAFHAYIDSLNMYVHIYICGSGGSYMLSYQSETSFSASAFFVRVRMMNNL